MANSNLPYFHSTEKLSESFKLRDDSKMEDPEQDMDAVLTTTPFTDTVVGQEAKVEPTMDRVCTERLAASSNVFWFTVATRVPALLLVVAK